MVSALIFIEGGGDGQLHERSFRKALETLVVIHEND